MSNIDTLLAARHDPARRVPDLPQPPADAAGAYAIQAEVMGKLGGIGGWKVGFTPATGAFSCAPLPAAFVKPGPAAVPQAECPDRGIEAEIAVRMGRDLPPRAEPYTTEEVLAAIQSAHPAIELLQSRFTDVNTVNPLSNLADSLSHFGLVYGPAIPDWRTIDLSREGVAILVNGAEIKRARANPAGDMIPLVVWMANQGARWAGGLKEGQVVTTGSWTGKDFVPEGAHVVIRFEHCGEVACTYGAGGAA